jgi:signal transduction histidine kinase
MRKDNDSQQNVPNILIVDDVPANLRLLDHILKDKGYKVRPVPNGTLALQVAEKEKPDIILLDVMMPDIDGFEVCRRIKENPKLNDVPIIFISALNDTNDIVKALTSGGADFITKPFKAEEVRVRVATHLNIYWQKKELQRLNAEKDKFFSIIAHDLRGPFSSFLGVTQLLDEKLSELTREDIQDFAASMRSSATNLFNLLENLLQWAKIKQGLIPFEPTNILLFKIAEESIVNVHEAAKNKGIGIVNNIGDSIEVYADKNMLQTVIRNLVSNAIKFTPRGGKIFLEAKDGKDQAVEVSVKDSGIGMNQVMVDNLFRLDVRTNRPGTEGEASTGLGLILCKDFIEKQGGQIWVESEEGKGSVFHFTVPGSDE